MDLSYEDVQNILKIIDGSSLEELHLEIGDFKLIVRKKGAGTAPANTASAGQTPEAYRAEAPGVVSAEALPATPVPVWPEGGPEGVVTANVQAAAATKAGRPSPAVRAGGVEVKAPMVGTFYRVPAPGAPPFVEVGSVVNEDDTVCIIEVMKLMNSIRAGCRGRVIEICAENGALVEFGQTLMVIEPLL